MEKASPPRFAQRLQNLPWARFGPRFAAASLITAAFCLFFLAAFSMRFQVNDDATLSNIAAGAYGADTVHLVHIHTLLGLLLKPFYLLFPGANWLVILSYIAAMLCFACIGALLMGRAGPARGALLHVAFMLLAGQDFFTRWHYSKYAGLFLALGLLLIALHLGKWNAATILGMLLVFAGSLMRFDQLYPIGALSAPLLLWRFWPLSKRAKINAALCVAGILALCFAVKSVDIIAYRSDESWARHTRYNAVRTEISDFRLQFATGEELAALGLSETDISLLEHWMFYDENVFSLERLEEIRDALPAHAPLGQTVRGTASNLLWSLFGLPHRILFALCLLGWLFFSRKKAWPVFVGTLAVFGFLVLFLTWRGRYIERVEYSYLTSIVLFLIPVFQWRRPQGLRIMGFALCLSLVAIAPMYNESFHDMRHYLGSRSYAAGRVAPLLQDESHLYIVDVQMLDAFSGFDVWQARGAGSFSNVVFVHSWLMCAPQQEQVLHSFGLSTPYEGTWDRADILFVESYHHSTLREAYIREHYNPDVTAEIIEQNDVYTLYRLVTVLG